jgi:hypothetical protein
MHLVGHFRILCHDARKHKYQVISWLVFILKMISAGTEFLDRLQRKISKLFPRCTSRHFPARKNSTNQASGHSFCFYSEGTRFEVWRRHRLSWQKIFSLCCCCCFRQFRVVSEIRTATFRFKSFQINRSIIITQFAFTYIKSAKSGAAFYSSEDFQTWR